MSDRVHDHGELVATPHGAVHVEVQGDDGPAVVLVSGGPGTSHSHYHPWFDDLSTGRRVVYYDHPATGRSPRDVGPEALTISHFAEAITAIRRHLDVPSVALVALSFGGVPALAHALTHPDAVHALVLSNAQHCGETWQQGNIDAVNQAVRELFPERWARLLDLRARGMRSLDPSYQDLIDPVLADLAWVDPFDHPRLNPDAASHDAPNLEVYEAFAGPDPEWLVGGELAAFDPRPRLGELAMPTLVLTGRWDRLTPPRIAHDLHAHLPRERARMHVFERSAHRPWVEQHRDYMALVGDFLAEAEAALPGRA